MYELEKINDVLVKPISVPSYKPEEIKGYDIIPLLYANIFVCGKKGSGKTNVIFEIMKRCIDRKTLVVIFCATHNSDDNWLKIKEWLDKREQPHVFYDSIVDEDALLLLEKNIQLKNAAREERKKEGNKNASVHPLYELLNPTPVKPNTKNKQKTAEYFVVFDDISADLRNGKSVVTFMKQHRHYKSKVIVSSQYPNDLDRPGREQVDIWCLFKGFGEDKMKIIFPQLALFNISFDNFFKMYQEVTAKSHNFLYIDRNKSEYRQNFDQRIILKPH